MKAGDLAIITARDEVGLVAARVVLHAVDTLNVSLTPLEREMWVLRA